MRAYFQLKPIPFLNPLKPFTLLNVIIGMISGDKRIEMALPDVTAKTMTSGGYGRSNPLRIPPTKTITVSGPNPQNPKITTINGKKYNRFKNGTEDCKL